MNRTNLPIEALFPKLMRTAVYKTRNDSEAADLVSETVIAALRAEAAGIVIKNAEAYLMRTMDNLFHTQLRRKYGVIVMSIDDEHLYTLASNEPSAEETLISKEDAEEMEKCFEAQKTFVNTHRSELDKIFREAFEVLLEKPYLKNKSESIKRSALSFFGIDAFRIIMFKAVKKSLP